MLQLIDECLWDYNVDVVIIVDVVKSSMSYVVVDVVIVVDVVKSLKLYVVVESMHTHIKLGAWCPVNVNHSNTLIWEPMLFYELMLHTLILGVDAPHVDFRSYLLQL